MSKLRWTLVAIASVGMAFPAAAQITSGGYARNVAECHAQFRLSDLDGNGVLTPGEISESRGSIPTSLSGQDVIFRQDFLNACAATIGDRGWSENDRNN